MESRDWNDPDEEPAMDALVEVVLHGDDAVYCGRCVRPRKLWVELENHPSVDLIADERSIAKWRYAE